MLVAQLAESSHAFLDERLRHCKVALKRDGHCELELRVRDAPRVAELAVKGERLLSSTLEGFHADRGLRREMSRSRQRLCARLGRLTVGVEQVFETAHAFGGVASQAPELPDASCQTQRQSGMTRALEPIESSSHIVVVSLEPIE